MARVISGRRILSPTDPTFVAAILNQDVIPIRLRKLQSVESGLNDGIALPAVMVFLDLALHREPHLLRELLQAGFGLLTGAAVPATFLWLESRRFFEADERY